MPRSTSQLRKLWSPACSKSTTSVTLTDGVRIHVRKGTEEAWRALGAILDRHGYKVRQRDTGAYVCRKITGGSGYSLHAYGIAADINWTTNPYRSDGRLITDYPKPMRDEIKALRTNGGARVFAWGGDWRSVKDSMHWQIDCTPAELSKGVRGLDRELGTRLLELADPLLRGEDVKAWQQMLRTMGHTVEVDGWFGENTVKATRAAQKLVNVEVDGVVGPNTLRAVRRYLKALEDYQPDHFSVAVVSSGADRDIAQGIAKEMGIVLLDPDEAPKAEHILVIGGPASDVVEDLDHSWDHRVELIGATREETEDLVVSFRQRWIRAGRPRQLRGLDF